MYGRVLSTLGGALSTHPPPGFGKREKVQTCTIAIMAVLWGVLVIPAFAPKDIPPVNLTLLEPFVSHVNDAQDMTGGLATFDGFPPYLS